MKKKDDTVRSCLSRDWALLLLSLVFLAASPELLPSKALGQGKSLSPTYQPLSASALNSLVGPVALYPDPLLAQVLQAATYPNEIAQASGWLQQNPDQSQLDQQSWDPSVVAVAHYPSVVSMMSNQMPWTMQLGLAYVNQQKDVMQAVQSMRAQAQKKGNLTSTAQQTVTTQGSNIVIVPASPDVIYVPQYDPVVVYTQPAVAAPLMAFSAGMIMGSWMGSTCDWENNVVVYRGWNGGWGHYYYGPAGPGYGPYHHGMAWHGTTPDGGTWDHGAVAGRTADGGAYAARGGAVDTAGGGEFSRYKAAGASPGIGAASARGWDFQNGDNAAGGFSKTVATDDGIYHVHGGGATDGDQSAGRVTVSGVNRDGDYGTHTWTGNDGDRDSSSGRSGNVFSGARDEDRASEFSNRGFESRASSFGGFQGGGGGFHGFGGGGGFHGGGRR